MTVLVGMNEAEVEGRTGNLASWIDVDLRPSESKTDNKNSNHNVVFIDPIAGRVRVIQQIPPQAQHGLEPQC